MSDYTGPVGPTKEAWEKWYQRMANVARMLWHPERRQGFACNAKDEAMMRDMLDRLKDDEDWQWDEVPPLVVSRVVPPGEIRAVDPNTIEILRFDQVLRSNKGHGRFAGLLTPQRDELHNPWRQKNQR